MIVLHCLGQEGQLGCRLLAELEGFGLLAVTLAAKHRVVLTQDATLALLAKLV